MNLQRRINKTHDKLDVLMAYAQQAFGIPRHDHPDCEFCKRRPRSLADADRWPTEDEEPITTAYELSTRKDRSE